MKHYVSIVTGILTAGLTVAGVALIIAATELGTIERYDLTALLAGMVCLVGAAAFGAIAYMTYMNPHDRREYRLARAERRAERSGYRYPTTDTGSHLIVRDSEAQPRQGH